MSDSFEQPRSNNPNAPPLPYQVYTQEKEYFAGSVIGAVVYGIVIALFFQCMSALLNPVYRTKKAVKWGLVTHTVTMFSVLTIGMTINRRTFSTAYIDNRGVHIADPYPSGPLEYLKSPNSALQTMQTIAFLSSPIKQWLIDGLLLYRCYVIYSKNYWATAIPGLMYLASIAMSLSPLYRLDDDYLFHALEVSYYSISGPLNVLLTLMIIARLVLHKRNTRNAVGASSGPCGLYTAIVVALVESSSLYTFTYLLYLVPFALHSSASNIFLSFGGIQVISSFLIILRVADRRALTSEAVASGNVSPIHFRSGERSTGSRETLPGGHPMGHMDTNGETPGEYDVGVETAFRET